MAPYKINRDTHLQHRLMDAVEYNDSFYQSMRTRMSRLFSAFLNAGTTILLLALWATAIYFTGKGLYLLGVWAWNSLKSQYRSRTRYSPLSSPSLKEKDIESQYHKEPTWSFPSLATFSFSSFSGKPKTEPHYSPRSGTSYGEFHHSEKTHAVTSTRELPDGFTEYSFDESTRQH